jgi:hypothetical protein
MFAEIGNGEIRRLIFVIGGYYVALSVRLATPVLKGLS